MESKNSRFAVPKDNFEMKGKFLAVTLLICMAVLVGGTTPLIAQPKTFKIGYVGGLTGPLAVHTVPAVAGMKYAIEDINRTGGFQGKQIEFIVRDGKERPDVSLSEARNLVLAEGINALIAGTSAPVVMALSAFAKENKMIFIAYPSGTMVWGKEGHRYVFKFNPTSDNFGYATGEYIALKPWKKYYTIGTDHVMGRGCVEYAWQRLSEKKPGVTRLGAFWSKLGQGDFVSYITAIMAANPDAVIALLSGSDCIDFIRQAKNLGFFKKIQFINTLMTTSEPVAMGKEMPEGITYTSEYDTAHCEMNFPLARKVQERYDRDYKDRNYTNAIWGYNSMLLLSEAAKKAQSTNTEKIIDALEGLEIDSGVGRIKVLKYSHRTNAPVFVGTTKFGPKYPFAIMGDMKIYQGENVMIPEDEVRKMRGE